MSECTEERFLKDVASHQMIVIRDDGVHRHIRFKRPGTGCMHFDLVTWPGYLCYCGDMGTYVFSRLDDMFEFFRTDREYANRNGRKLGINLGYWSEKLQAVDGNRNEAGATEFSEDRFRSVINEYRKGWIGNCRERGCSKEDRRELWEAVDHQVLSRIDDDSSGNVAMHAAYDFSERVGNKTYSFDDLFDHDFTQFTYRFVWCCYALAWGVQQYDMPRIGEPVAKEAA